MMKPSSLILILAAIVLSSSSNAGQESTAPRVPGSADKTVYADNSTLPYFSPKVDLDQVRFVFHNKGRLFVELSQPQEMLLDSFVASGRTLPPFLEEGFMFEDLAPKDQEYVFNNIPDARCEKYSVFFWNSFHCETRTLSGLTLYPTGDGGFRGFMGVFDGRAPEPALVGDELGIDLKEVGLAFKSGTPAKAKRMPAGEIDESRKDAILEFIRSSLYAGDSSLYLWLDPSVRYPKSSEWVEIFVEYPALRATLVVVEFTKLEFERERHVKYLFCVVEEGKRFTMIPFGRSPHHAFDAGLYYQDDGGETDTTPSHSELFVLPDMDGDGANELLIASNVSMLFQLTREMVRDAETGKYECQYYWRDLHRVYFGP